MEEKKIIVENELGTRRESFVKAQGIDREAAFKRMTITKDTLEQYQAAINATNTADIISTHKDLYDRLERTMKAIIDEELVLIAMCK